MTKEQADRIFTVVSKTVLTSIKTMTDKQRIRKPICLDSVSLVLKISLKDLTPIVEHLQSEGHLMIHPNPAGKLGRTNKPDHISLN